MKTKDEFINIDSIKKNNGRTCLIPFRNFRKLKRRVVDDYVVFTILYSLVKKEFDALDISERKSYLYSIKDYHDSNIDVGKMVKEYVIAPVSIFVGLSIGVILSSEIQILIAMLAALFVVGAVIAFVAWRKGYDDICLRVIEKYVEESEIVF